MRPTPVMVLLAACAGDLPSLPSEAPAPEGPLEAGKTAVRERRPIVPQALSGPKPPPPEVAFEAGRCGELTRGGPTKDGCVTDTITCGETVIGHTLGGAHRFDSAFYKDKFCTPDTTDHDGGDERVYRLVMPEGDWHAVVTLDTPCADLDLAAIFWSRDDCPTGDHMISRCEMFPKRGTSREQLELVSQGASQWLIVVEGKDDHEGAFGLAVQCYKGLY